MSDEAFDDTPSKSARKRAALAAQDLGARLIALRETELVSLDLPEPLLDAVREARRLTSRAALARQRQYIGKLMRDIDTASIEAALEARSGASGLDARLHKQAERWRQRLLAEGDDALDEFAAAHAPLDRAQLASLIHAAGNPHVSAGTRTTAARRLFRALRALIRRPADPNC
jgi:ribosome-associated protein